jgi:hypothetical protein
VIADRCRSDGPALAFFLQDETVRLMGAVPPRPTRFQRPGGRAYGATGRAASLGGALGRWDCGRRGRRVGGYRRGASCPPCHPFAGPAPAGCRESRLDEVLADDLPPGCLSPPERGGTVARAGPAARFARAWSATRCSPPQRETTVPSSASTARGLHKMAGVQRSADGHARISTEAQASTKPAARRCWPAPTHSPARSSRQRARPAPAIKS